MSAVLCIWCSIGQCQRDLGIRVPASVLGLEVVNPMETNGRSSKLFSSQFDMAELRIGQLATVTGTAVN